MNFNALLSAQDNLRALHGAHPIGSLIWWTLSGTKIDRSQLITIAAQHGLDPKLLPAEIKPAQAFRRACRHASAKLGEGFMLRPILETSDEILIGLVRERPDEAAKDINYDVLARIAFSKSSARIEADVAHPVVVQVRDLMQFHLAHTTEDVRSMLTTFLTEVGVSLREAGGVYWVPQEHRDQLDALCTVVESIGRNTTFRLPLIDAPGVRSTLREVTERTLTHEVHELEAELAGFDPDSVRESTLARRLERFDRLRSRASLFAGVLAFKANEIEARIAAMEGAVRQRLGLEPVSAAMETPAPTRRQEPRAVVSEIGF